MTQPETWPFRPHHLMCWQTYRGRGYSPAFVAQFDALKAQAAANPGLMIRLEIASDPICGPCPHRRGRSCATAVSVDARDRALLTISGFSDGAVMSLAAGLETVRPAFLEWQERVCQGCEWVSVCRESYGDGETVR